MTRRIHLRLAGRNFDFTLEGVMAASALVAAGFILVAFVDTLHDSIRRGESLRETQSSNLNLIASPRPPAKLVFRAIPKHP